MKNNINFDEYKKSKDNLYVNNFLIATMIFILVITILILYKFDFKTYEEHTLIKNDNYYTMILNSNDISFIENNSTLYINRKKYSYKIKKIDADYTNINNVIYQTVHIKLHNYKTESKVSKCYFLKSKKSILKSLIEFIKGGKYEET